MGREGARQTKTCRGYIRTHLVIPTAPGAAPAASSGERKTTSDPCFSPGATSRVAAEGSAAAEDDEEDEDEEGAAGPAPAADDEEDIEKLCCS